MGAIDRLTVKLAAVRHVRDARYWHLPVGTPIVARPKLGHLQSAAPGSQLKIGPEGAANVPTFAKNAGGTWDQMGVSTGFTKPKAITSEDLIKKIGNQDAHLALRDMSKPAAPGTPATPQKAVFKGPARQVAPVKKQFQKGDLVQTDQGGGTRYGGKVVKHEGDTVTVEHRSISGPGSYTKDYPARKVHADSPQQYHVQPVAKHPKPTARQMAESAMAASEASRKAKRENTAQAHEAAQTANRRAARIHLEGGNQVGAKAHGKRADEHKAASALIKATESRQISNERSAAANKANTVEAHTDAARSNHKAADLHKAAGDTAGEAFHRNRATVHEGKAKEIETAQVKAAHKVLADQEKIKGELSDAQYAQRQQAIETVIKANKNLATENQYRRFGVWDPERAKQHQAIVEKMLGEQTKTAKKDKQMLIAGGLGGAGKSTTLGMVGVDQKDYVTINPDDVKEEMAKRGMVPKIDGLSPMEAASLIHEESGDIANAMLRAAEEQGYNVIQDITMSSMQTIDRRLREAQTYGYKGVHAMFVDIPVESSVQRALARHRRGMEAHRAGKGNGGRYVPPSIIRKSSDPEFGSINRHAFEAMRKHFVGWQLWDNSGTGPQHVKTGGSWSL